ncbi:MAG: gliding motility-associated C-terminal domain-containing protein [Saprospiraceae bacterium]|nr:gliding motility-associated C-terminal domain-containing protein [Saprospiraceae bacterium]
MNYKIFTLLLLIVALPLLVTAQPINDECNTAIDIPSQEKYCSDKGEFTLEGATPSGFAAPACWRNGERSHDIWFRFQAIRTSVRITVIGRNSINAASGTLNEPEAALYGGNCATTINRLDCASDLAGNNIIEMYESQLVVGNFYYIRVDARSTNTGTFQLCVEQTDPPVIAGSDCSTAALLCDKSRVLVEKTLGEGLDPTEMNYSCFSNGSGQNAERDSKWFKFKCGQSGDFTFVLTPNNPTDDLDFVLLEIPDIDMCEPRILLRCMASGEDPALFPTRCHGPTGLREGETDISEPAGCNDPSQNNFLAPVDLEVGKTYVLGVSNFSNTGAGFTLEFGGSAEFQGPTANFIVDPLSGLKCDEIFTVTDQSSFGNIGNITGWIWNFGSGAIPQSDSTQGPHNVAYNSFGEKTISLTIETDLGCQITTLRKINVEPCCEDLADLVIQRDSIIDLLCGGDSTGVVFVSATGGSPDYKFGLLGDDLSRFGRIDGLSAGTYDIVAQDIKGCMDTIQVTLVEPPPLNVNAGSDRTIKLGECLDLTGTVTPPGRNVVYKWSGGGDDDIECDTCERTKVLPTMGTSTYVIEVRDSLGCEDEDSVTIIVEIVRPFFAPNVISSNGDGLNDVFTIFGGSGLEAVITLEVYDRWGEMVYRGENFPPGQDGIDMGFGWNGYFHGEPMMPAVFAYKAVLKYIDGVEITVHGDFTIVR